MTTSERPQSALKLWIGAVGIVLFVAGVSFGVQRYLVDQATEEGRPVAEQRAAQRAEQQAQQERTDTLEKMLLMVQQRLEDSPLDSMLVISAANIAYDLGAFAVAEVYYNRFLDSIDPRNTAAAIDRAFVVFKQGRHSDAEGMLQRIIDADPRNQTAMYNMAFMTYERGQVEESRMWMERVVAADPSSQIGKTAAEVLKQQKPQP